jgi:hypothetical protein
MAANCPLKSPPSIYANVGKEINKGSRHVGLEFYDLLIEARIENWPSGGNERNEDVRQLHDAFWIGDRPPGMAPETLESGMPWCSPGQAGNIREPTASVWLR